MSNTSGNNAQKQIQRQMGYKIKKIMLKKNNKTQGSSLSKVAKKGHLFNFDHVFAANCKTEQIYISMVRPIVDKVIKRGVNGAILMYGQTNSGKTYTMQGNQPSDTNEGVL